MAGLNDFYSGAGPGINPPVVLPPKGRRQGLGRYGSFRPKTRRSRYGRGFLGTFMRIAEMLGATGAAKRGYRKMFRDDEKGRRGGALAFNPLGGYGFSSGFNPPSLPTRERDDYI